MADLSIRRKVFFSEFYNVTPRPFVFVFFLAAFWYINRYVWFKRVSRRCCCKTIYGFKIGVTRKSSLPYFSNAIRDCYWRNFAGISINICKAKAWFKSVRTNLCYAFRNIDWWNISIVTITESKLSNPFNSVWNIRNY